MKKQERDGKKEEKKQTAIKLIVHANTSFILLLY